MFLCAVIEVDTQNDSIYSLQLREAPSSIFPLSLSSMKSTIDLTLCLGHAEH